MKSIKIILTVAVVAVIGICVWKFTGERITDTALTKTKNPWVKGIKAEIDSVIVAQTNFVKASKSYANIQAHIEDNDGRLSEVAGDAASNETNKRLLSEWLYASYFKKFVELTYNVFNGSDWQQKDLQTIDVEISRLKTSPYFDGKDYQGKEMKTFTSVLSKYREIAGFIGACNNFSYSHYELSGRFPDVGDIVKKSRAYLNNNLDNSYVNNCTRLKDGLRAIPQTLFNKHVAYLDKKIKENGEKYEEYGNKTDYSNNIYNRLYYQIANMSEDTYGIPVGKAQDKLLALLDECNDKATKYYREKDNY